MHRTPGGRTRGGGGGGFVLVPQIDAPTDFDGEEQEQTGRQPLRRRTQKDFRSQVQQVLRQRVVQYNLGFQTSVQGSPAFSDTTLVGDYLDVPTHDHEEVDIGDYLEYHGHYGPEISQFNRTPSLKAGLGIEVGSQPVASGLSPNGLHVDDRWDHISYHGSEGKIQEQYPTEPQNYKPRVLRRPFLVAIFSVLVILLALAALAIQLLPHASGAIPSPESNSTEIRRRSAVFGQFYPSDFLIPFKRQNGTNPDGNPPPDAGTTPSTSAEVTTTTTPSSSATQTHTKPSTTITTSVKSETSQSSTTSTEIPTPPITIPNLPPEPAPTASTSSLVPDIPLPPPSSTTTSISSPSSSPLPPPTSTRSQVGEPHPHPSPPSSSPTFEPPPPPPPPTPASSTSKNHPLPPSSSAPSTPSSTPSSTLSPATTFPGKQESNTATITVTSTSEATTSEAGDPSPTSTLPDQPTKPDPPKPNPSSSESTSYESTPTSPTSTGKTQTPLPPASPTRSKPDTPSTSHQSPPSSTSTKSLSSSSTFVDIPTVIDAPTSVIASPPHTASTDHESSTDLTPSVTSTLEKSKAHTVQSLSSSSPTIETKSAELPPITTTIITSANLSNGLFSQTSFVSIIRPIKGGYFLETEDSTRFDSLGHAISTEKVLKQLSVGLTTYTDANGKPTSTGAIIYNIPLSQTTLTDYQGRATKTLDYYVSQTTEVLRDENGIPTTTRTSAVTEGVHLTTLYDSNNVATLTKTEFVPLSTTTTVLLPSSTASPNEQGSKALHVVSMSDGKYFLGLMLPTLIAIAVSVPIRLIDQNARLYQPFHALATSSESKARDSLCFQTSDPWNLQARARLLLNGDILLTLTGLLLLGSIIMVPLSSEAVRVTLSGPDCSPTALVSSTCNMALGVYPIPAYITIGLLAFMTILAGVVVFVLRKWKTGLDWNPWSMFHMGHLAANHEVRTLLLRRLREKKGRITSKEATKVFTGVPFVLDYWKDNEDLKYSILIPNEAHSLKREGKSGLARKGNVRRRRRKGNAIPFFILTWTGRLLFVALLCALQVGLLIYNITGEDQEYTEFINGRWRIVRFVFTGVSVLVSLAWYSFFYGRFMHHVCLLVSTHQY